jgi:hypothetical protein
VSAIRTKTLTVAGALAQKPHAGGHTWALLQYVLGFRQLGWNVLFLDQIDARMCTDAAGQPCPPEDSIQARYFHDVMTRFDLQDACALVVDGGQFLGLSRPRVLERLSASAFLLNIMGYLQIDDLLAAVPARVFLDIDPGFGQMWKALGLHDPFRGHDAHVTIGLRIGEPDCPIPTGGISWITTPQPIALDYWPVTPRVTDGPFTSVASWRGANGPVTFEGRTYGLRVHEFPKVRRLAGADRRPFAVALDIHPDDARDRDLLTANGWRLDDPRQVAGDPMPIRPTSRAPPPSSSPPRTCTCRPTPDGSAIAACVISRAAGRSSPRTPASARSIRPTPVCCATALWMTHAPVSSDLRRLRPSGARGADGGDGDLRRDQGARTSARSARRQLTQAARDPDRFGKPVARVLPGRRPAIRPSEHAHGEVQATAIEVEEEIARQTRRRATRTALLGEIGSRQRQLRLLGPACRQGRQIDQTGPQRAHFPIHRTDTARPRVGADNHVARVELAVNHRARQPHETHHAGA